MLYASFSLRPHSDSAGGDAVAAVPARGAAQNNTANVSCGDPNKTGIVIIRIVLKKEGEEDMTISWNASIDMSDDENDKASDIRAQRLPPETSWMRSGAPTTS